MKSFHVLLWAVLFSFSGLSQAEVTEEPQVDETEVESGEEEGSDSKATLAKKAASIGAGFAIGWWGSECVVRGRVGCLRSISRSVQFAKARIITKSVDLYGLDELSVSYRTFQEDAGGELIDSAGTMRDRARGKSQVWKPWPKRHWLNPFKGKEAVYYHHVGESIHKVKPIEGAFDDSLVMMGRHPNHREILYFRFEHTDDGFTEFVFDLPPASEYFVHDLTFDRRLFEHVKSKLPLSDQQDTERMGEMAVEFRKLLFHLTSEGVEDDLFKQGKIEFP